MAAKTEAQLKNALINVYVKEFTDTHGKKPSINRFKLGWGFVDMLNDLDYDRAKEIIEFYFTLDGSHTVEHLLSNYDKLDQLMDTQRADELEREQIREATRKRVEEWSQRRGITGRRNDSSGTKE